MTALAYDFQSFLAMREPSTATHIEVYATIVALSPLSIQHTSDGLDVYTDLGRVSVNAELHPKPARQGRGLLAAVDIHSSFVRARFYMAPDCQSSIILSSDSATNHSVAPSKPENLALSAAAER